jgi:aldose 1-epimerase
MKTDKKSFGKTRNNKDANLYTLTNKNGMSVSVTDYGAALVSLVVPDKKGTLRDIVWGFDDVTGYENATTYMGATIGRHAGQVWHGHFELNGESYKLVINDQDHTMHGGPEGFHSRMFSVESFDENGLILSYLSKDGEAGFPGNLKVTVTYKLSDENTLNIDFHGICDKDTVLSMTNHAYFNLNGPDSNSAMDHHLKIYAAQYTEVDEQGVPTGKIFPVQGTVYDFTDFHVIGDRINEPHRELGFCKGYDHNWVISPVKDGVMRLCCELKNRDSSLQLQLFSNQPGLQMYSGNYLNGSEKGKNNTAYISRSAVCLEPQLCPNGLCIPHFPSPVLKKGEEYKYNSVYKFI